MEPSVNERRTRANSAPLNARVTLELAHRLRLHVAEQACGNISDFVTAAIEEKLARDSVRANAARLMQTEPLHELHLSPSGPTDSRLAN
jgi:hypothetical protein